jgi:hypothetical protein
MPPASFAYRLVKLGDPAAPAIVFPIWEEDGRLLLREWEFTLPIETSRTLDELTIEDLPDWLTGQGHPVALTPVERIVAPTAEDAFQMLLDAAAAAAGERVRQAA